MGPRLEAGTQTAAGKCRAIATRPTATLASAACLLVLGLVASGCGPSGNGEAAKTASQVWADARAATLGAKDFRVTGSITNQGQTVKLDLAMSKTGNGGGTITLEGDTVHLVVAKGLVYMKAGAPAWSAISGGNSMAKYAGKWVMTPLSGSSISNFASFASSTKFLANLKAKGKLTKSPKLVTLDGHDTIVLSDTTTAKTYVAATGKPYVLRVSGGDKSSHGTMEFSQFGTAVLPPAPKGAVSFTS